VRSDAASDSGAVVDLAAVVGGRRHLR
jgi:hypothetical protein